MLIIIVIFDILFLDYYSRACKRPRASEKLQPQFSFAPSLTLQNGGSPMSQLAYFTRGNTSPQGKPRVYFCCHPDDQDVFLKSTVKELLSHADCSVWYNPEPNALLSAQERRERESDLAQMQLFVLTVTAQADPLACRITVEDTGGGIDPDDLPHLFERFYRGKSAGPESAGIGLALAQAIVTEQGGRITAENHGPGARFTLTLPNAVV